MESMSSSDNEESSLFIGRVLMSEGSFVQNVKCCRDQMDWDKKNPDYKKFVKRISICSQGLQEIISVFDLSMNRKSIAN